MVIIIKYKYLGRVWLMEAVWIFALPYTTVWLTVHVLCGKWIDHRVANESWRRRVQGV